MAKISILLATYNGEKYIKSQIYSIIMQSYQDWILIIHDDGSTDNTINIIKSFDDKRIVLIDDDIICGGAAQNFMYLTRFVESDFIMFCDQDDIWFDNKIALMIDFFITKDHSKAQVLYSNSYAWKPEEGIEGLSTYTFPKSIQQFLFLNSGIQGCVAIFNKKMCKILSNWDKQLLMHDQILNLAGLLLGEVSYLHVPLMIYRKSGENLTGETIVKKNDVNRIIQNKYSPVVHKEHYDVVLKFYEKYKDQIGEKNLRLIEFYIKMANQGLFNRLLSVLKNDFVLFDSKLRLIIKIILRPYIGYIQK